MGKNMLTELAEGIVDIMGSRLSSIVLYGSVARGTNTEESDVDIALIMYGKLDFGTEDRLSDFIVDMNLKYDKVFSVIDIDIRHFQKWMKVLPFYQNVEREGSCYGKQPERTVPIFERKRESVTRSLNGKDSE